MAPASSTRIECLILDLFGVIASFDDRLVYDRIARHCAKPQEAAEQMRGLVSDPSLIRGKTTLEALYAQLDADMGLRATFREFKCMWVRSYSEPMPGMRGLLRELTGQCRLVLLSNVDRYYWPTVRRSVPELKGFYAQTLSFEHGVAKPEAAAFIRAATLAGVPSDRCYFVDDKAENIEAAAKFGLAGHHFTNAATLKAALRQAGLHTE